MEQKTKKPISKSLIKRLHIIYSAQGIDDEQKRAILLDLTDGRTNTTKELTYSEAMYLCGYLNGAKKRKPGFDYHRTGNKETQVGCPEESAADRNRHNRLGSGKCVLP